MDYNKTMGTGKRETNIFFFWECRAKKPKTNS